MTAATNAQAQGTINAQATKNNKKGEKRKRDVKPRLNSLVPPKPMHEKTRYKVDLKLEFFNDKIFSLFRSNGRFLVDILGMAQHVWTEKAYLGEAPGSLDAAVNALNAQITQIRDAMKKNNEILDRKLKSNSGLEAMPKSDHKFDFTLPVSSSCGMRYVEAFKAADELYTSIAISQMFGDAVESSERLLVMRESVLKSLQGINQAIYDAFFTRINPGQELPDRLKKD